MKIINQAEQIFSYNLFITNSFLIYLYITNLYVLLQSIFLNGEREGELFIAISMIGSFDQFHPF